MAARRASRSRRSPDFSDPSETVGQGNRSDLRNGGGKRIVVTGGAGFIGGHVVEALVRAGAEVTIVDLVKPDPALWGLPKAKIRVLQGDCGDAGILDKCLPGADSVWHLAADPDVRSGAADPARQFRANVESTLGLLEGMRRHGNRELVFTSTSTVYGRADLRPTPEEYAPLLPVSAYGASKLACEAAVAAYAELVPFRALMFRFANVVGPRSGHGVIFDFVHKLRADPGRLEVLGDGTQDKSYCSVQDTVEAMMHAVRHCEADVDVFNIASADSTTVDELAAIVAGVRGLKPRLVHTGGAPDGSGWKGDVKSMALGIRKLGRLGWTPRHSSAEAIKIAANAAWAQPVRG